MAIAVPYKLSDKRMIDGVGRQNLIDLKEIENSI